MLPNFKAVGQIQAELLILKAEKLGYVYNISFLKSGHIY